MSSLFTLLNELYELTLLFTFKYHQFPTTTYFRRFNLPFSGPYFHKALYSARKDLRSCSLQVHFLNFQTKLVAHKADTYTLTQTHVHIH